MDSSTPSITEFDPTIIPYQFDVIDLVRNFNYSKGVLEILLSGSLGSAKSILMAHIGVTHSMIHPRSRILLGRRAFGDLKDTLIQKILEHMEGVLIEGKDYEFNKSTCQFKFKNGSEMISRSWHDKNFKRFRSLELSAALIEELTENGKEHWPFYAELRSRVGRLSHVKENFIICATNPDAPSHPAYKYFIESKHPLRPVFYSRTEDNPFLPENYITQLKDTYDEKEARRMLYGEWIEIKSEVIYHSFSEQNIIETYEIRRDLPICFTFDFNIGIGKPMSIAFFQYDTFKDEFYFFDEVVVFSANTEEVMGDAYEKGLFRAGTTYVIHGDCNGRARSTKSNRTDYEIIKNFMERLRMNFVIDVPLSNPSVRHRHVIVNGYLRNANKKARLFVTKNCKTILEGLRLSRLKKGSGYVEDDSDHFQHITTAMGYGILSAIEYSKSGSNFKKIKF